MKMSNQKNGFSNKEIGIFQNLVSKTDKVEKMENVPDIASGDPSPMEDMIPVSGYHLIPRAEEEERKKRIEEIMKGGKHGSI